LNTPYYRVVGAFKFTRHFASLARGAADKYANATNAARGPPVAHEKFAGWAKGGFLAQESGYGAGFTL
jgi:hypothetical protein